VSSEDPANRGVDAGPGRGRRREHADWTRREQSARERLDTLKSRKAETARELEAAKDRPGALERCSRCGYDLEGVPSEQRGCPECGDPIDARLCRRCGYDLRGITWYPASCPECGQGFDPRDKGSYMAQPRREAVRKRVRRYGIPALLLVLLVIGTESGVVPRPADFRNPRLWQWWGELYGVEIVSNGRSLRNERGYGFVREGRIHWWGDDQRPHKVRGTDEAGDERWSVRRLDDGSWEVEVADPDTSWGEVMTSFGWMKPDWFGVEYDQRPSASKIGRRMSLGGHTVDVFGAMLLGSKTDIRPFVVNSRQEYVWVLDHLEGRLSAIDIDEATEAGIEIGRSRRFRTPDRALVIPRPSDIVSAQEVPLSSEPDEQASGS